MFGSFQDGSSDFENVHTGHSGHPMQIGETKRAERDASSELKRPTARGRCAMSVRSCSGARFRIVGSQIQSNEARSFGLISAH
jgi:hypothetical protein